MQKRPKAVVITSSLSDLSRSRTGAELAATELKELGCDVTIIDLQDLPLDTYPRCKQDPDLQHAIDIFNSAELGVYASPVYCWGPSDRIIKFFTYALCKKTPRYIPFVLIAGAGSEKSYLALESLARMLVYDVHAVQVGPPILLAGEAVQPKIGLVDQQLQERIKNVMQQLVMFSDRRVVRSEVT